MDFGSLINSLAGGPQGQAGGNQSSAYDTWNQMVGSAPPEQFGRAAYGAITQVPPQQYQQHLETGANGANPIAQLPQNQRSSLAQSILSVLANRGIGLNSVAQGAGLSTTNPNQMSPSDLAGLLGWTHQNQPQAFGYVASQYQNQPNILQALLGNPALMSMLTSLGGQLFSNFMQGQNQNQSPQQGGSPGKWQ